MANDPLLISWATSNKSAGGSVTGVFARQPAVGNLLVAVIMCGTTATVAYSTAQQSGTTGWSNLFDQGNNPAGNSFCGVSAWTKIAGASEPAPVFTLNIGTTGRISTVTIFEVYNPNSTPLDVSGFVSNGSSSVNVATIAPATTANPSSPGGLAISGLQTVLAAAATVTFTKGSQTYQTAYQDATTSQQPHSIINYYNHQQLSTSRVFTDSIVQAASVSQWYAGFAIVIKGGTATRPPGTIAPSGPLWTQYSNSAQTTLPVFTMIPGDLFVFLPKVGNNAVNVSSITDTNGLLTGWTRIAGPFADTNGTSHTQEIWIATVVAAGTTTLNITYSAAIGTFFVEADAQEFSIGWGTWTTWAVDTGKTATLNQATASNTVTFPSLTPTDARGELLVGRGRVPAAGNWTNAIPTANLAEVSPNADFNPIVYATGVTSAIALGITNSNSDPYYLIEALVRQATTFPLAGSSANSSSANASINDQGVITGSAPSISHASGTISGTLAFSGSSSSVSAANGTVVLIAAIYGSAVSVSSASGAISRTSQLSGSSASVSSASGTVSATLAINGSSASVSTASGAISRTSPLTGSSASVSAASGTVSAVLTINGSAASVSAASGTISRIGLLAGSSASVSTASGAIVAILAVNGSSASVSAATGTMGAPLVAGSSSSVSAATGTVVALLATSGSSSTVSSASGSITEQGMLSGSAISVSAAHGTVVAIDTVSATSVTPSSASGTLSTAGGISGSSATASSATGTVIANLVISATSASASVANGNIFIAGGAQTYVLAGQSTTLSAASGAVVAVEAVSGVSATTSAANGSVTQRGVLSGSSATVSNASGAVVSNMAVAGSSVTLSSATGSIGGGAPITGSASAVSIAAGTVTLTGALSGSASSASSASGSLTGALGIAGVSVTVSSAFGTMVGSGLLSGSSITRSSASGWLPARMVISGVSVTVSGGDGEILPPFVSGALPPDVTAIVEVVSAPAVAVYTDSITASVTNSIPDAVVSTDAGKATVFTDSVQAQVT